ALFELLRAGVNGVNVHIRAHAINAPFKLTNRGLSARPLLYGLILFARTIGPDAQLLTVRLHAKRSLHLKAWAVRVRGGAVHVLLINKSEHSATVDLQLPASGPATVQRLIAPSTSSRSGVTLGGQQLARNGSWQGHPANETITPDNHRYQLTVPQFSAALLRLRLGALAFDSDLGHDLTQQYSRAAPRHRADQARRRPSQGARPRQVTSGIGF
ncbi:MAG: glycosyl hydrolase family 79 C-terminal domain-containing protein, partial [Solirubrobacteraceae bacterium]